MTRDERDLAKLDSLLTQHARSPGPALAPAVLARLHARRSRFSLRPFALAAAAAVLLVATGALVGYRAGASRAGDALTLAGVAPTRTVHFTLTAPGASTVALVGDFNGWTPTTTVLSRTGEDRFVATLELPPGRYAYAFVVDGERVVQDPGAPAFEPDGFGGRNSVLEL